MAEVFLAEAIRAYHQHQGATPSGWFRALDDPKTGHVLSRSHQDPAAAVGYQDVAAFSRAFKLLVGQSPARWRRTVA